MTKLGDITMPTTLIWLEDLRRGDVAKVGGKNSSLGEMIATLGAKGIKVPGGFATTSDAYRAFVEANDLRHVIRENMAAMDEHRITLQEAGAAIRKAFEKGVWPEAIAADIRAAYAELATRTRQDAPSVAVRSSATAEDLPDASFAGQQETFLNVIGEKALLAACRRCYASLFTDRAITYRNLNGFDHEDVALSIGVQQMVRSDMASSGVMFSIDTETGCDRFVLITGAWGLGENVVQGAVDPDEFQVFKPFLDNPDLSPIVAKDLGAKEIKMIYGAPGEAMTRNVPTSKAERARFTLNDAEVLSLARMAKTIEEHYGLPMDMEWAKDGITGELFIVQARPETVQSRANAHVLQSYSVTPAGPALLDGLAVGAAAAAGRACLIQSAADIDKFVDGSVLVTSITDPDWVPIMKRAAAIVTDHGGRTSHAAIVSRELGLPAIVGTGTATHELHDGQDLTVSCTEGNRGVVYAGIGEISTEDVSLDEIPETETKVMLNVADPSSTTRWWRLPADGVGLARMEFLVSNVIRAHPLALLNYDTLPEGEAKETIAKLTRGYEDKSEYFVDTLARGLGRIASVWYPNPVIVRLSDFKSNEYAELVGGSYYEPDEENPMIGLRGASRYYSDFYREAFALECKALRYLRGDMGFDNVVVMVPFCRSPEEADKVISVLAEHGLERGKDGLELYVMTEVPSNVIRAEEFAERFDGFSIGSNDLTQLTLGIDRDSESLSQLFRERDPAVLWMIETAIAKARAAGRKIGLCGQAPSNDPDFARLLVEAGIHSISVTPDSFLDVKRNVAEAEKKKRS
ncbi:phosphoenolpyruvate synthase [Roseibacterium sp. SDUM158016]|uniref:phosphoenolpyruvate synthase n=1 Tax=Roseicyclus sediminis TaxID=2980997 RepID=UPI0021D2739B|nr:phosphoenolpyruvate synthase [Roseibacterium sp. SDUM158016]MCU4651712.1 phosphoenolpyruvate synthase [Roseibacterium sp. SDUM158016]